MKVYLLMETENVPYPEGAWVEGVYADKAKAQAKADELNRPDTEGVQLYAPWVDGEDVGLTYITSNDGFERIRRITGYLVGTLDRFNDGKRAEEADRVKHGVDDV